jgi:probable addiction module antidote protein
VNAQSRYTNVKLASTTRDDSLNAAFASNELGRICGAIDVAVRRCGDISEIARSAKVDRTTLYRAFRNEGAPAFDTVANTLRALGYRLVVELRKEIASSDANSEFVNRTALARRLTAALEDGTRESLRKAFQDTVRDQKDIAAFAQKARTSRENVYRVFSHKPNPRFSTLLNFIGALELRFAVRRLSSRSSPRRKSAGRAVHGV